MKLRSTALAVLALASFPLGHEASGCGLDWSMPTNHFDGVNEFGYVSIWEKIGEIDAGDGLKLPLHINFRSDREKVSPYLGYGWHFALLESSFTQVDEKTFMMYEPAGLFRLFWRDGKNPNLLHGQGGWKAEIRDDIITAVAPCGTKMVFNKGRITTFENAGRRFDYVYTNNCVSEVREGNASLIKVNIGAGTGTVSGLTLADGSQVGVRLGERPLVQVVNGQPVVGGMAPSLGQMMHTDETESTIEYAVDDELNPTLNFGGRLIAWNPTSKRIVKDGEWTYEINPGAGLFDNARIGRKNATNQQELWFHENSRIVIYGAGGDQLTTGFFTSGSLAGKQRFVEKIDSNGLHILTKYTYNESGKIVRKSVSEHSGKTKTLLQKTANVYADDESLAFVFNISAVEGPLTYSYNKQTGEIKVP